MKTIRFIARCMLGFLCGVGAYYIIALIVCSVLRLGYFMPCLSALPEMVGGELPAAGLQALAFGLPGAALAALKRESFHARAVITLTFLAASLAPFVTILVMVTERASF